MTDKTKIAHILLKSMETAEPEAAIIRSCYWSASQKLQRAIERILPTAKHASRSRRSCPKTRKIEYDTFVELYIETLVKLAGDRYLDLGFEVWIPKPREARRRHGGTATYEKYVRAGLIRQHLYEPTETTPYPHFYRHTLRDECDNTVIEEGKCYLYAIDPALLLHLIMLDLDAQIAGDIRVNLITRSVINSRRIPSHKEWDFAGTETGPEFNIPYRAMQERVRRLLAVAESTGCGSLRARAMRVYVQVCRLQDSPEFKMIKDGTAKFREHSRLGNNGRRYAVGPSIQGMISEVAQCILDEDPEARNLDMSDCHARALATTISAINRSCTSHGVDRPWMMIPKKVAEAVYELADKGWDKLVAKAETLPRRALKTCVLAAWMGARFVASRDDNGKPTSEIMRELMDHHNGDWSAARRDLKRVQEITAPVVSVAEALKMTLWDMIDDPVRRTRVRRIIDFRTTGEGRVLINAAGGELVVRLADGSNPIDGKTGRRMSDDQVRRKMLSHVLTGLERSFMLPLLRELDALGIPYIDMHDGCVVWGSIPDAAIALARLGSPMKAHIHLKRKPLADPIEGDFARMLRRVGRSWDEVMSIDETSSQP